MQIICESSKISISSSNVNKIQSYLPVCLHKSVIFNDITQNLHYYHKKLNYSAVILTLGYNQTNFTCLQKKKNNFIDFQRKTNRKEIFFSRAQQLNITKTQSAVQKKLKYFLTENSAPKNITNDNY